MQSNAAPVGHPHAVNASPNYSLTSGGSANATVPMVSSGFPGAEPTSDAIKYADIPGGEALPDGRGR